jgi:hypothetical protein
VSGCTRAPPWFTAPPPSQGRGGSRVSLQPRRSTTPPPARISSPPLHASPSPGVDGYRAGMVQEPSPHPPPPPQQGSQAGHAGWRGLNNNYLATVLSPILDQHGPVLSEMAHSPIASQPSPGKISSLYTSVVSTPAFRHASFFANRLAVMRF